METNFYLAKRYNTIPEMISLILVLREMHGGELGHIILLLPIYAIAMRLIWQSATVIHGLGHSLAIALTDRKLAAISGNNILEHRDFRDILKSLIPFQELLIVAPPSSGSTFDIRFPYLESGSDDYIRIKAVSGIIANLVVVVSCYFCPPNFLSLSLIFANSVIILSSLSDLQALFTGVANRFYCGNFGLIAKRSPSDENTLLPSRMVNIAKQMGRETEIRGEQAGGGLVIGKKGQKTVFVGKKIVNQKRQNLTNSLESAFASTRNQAKRKGVKPLHPCLALSICH